MPRAFLTRETRDACGVTHKGTRLGSEIRKFVGQVPEEMPPSVGRMDRFCCSVSCELVVFLSTPSGRDGEELAKLQAVFQCFPDFCKSSEVEDPTRFGTCRRDLKIYIN